MIVELGDIAKIANDLDRLGLNRIAFTLRSNILLCRMCHKNMATKRLSSKGSNINKRFCTAACKQKDHRQKVSIAKAAWKRGVSIREIARHCNTDTKKIKNWLRKDK